jgi:PAS domain S-box-containing protein
VRKDGSRFWANVIITAVHDETGRLRGFSKVTRDITERKEVEAKLLEAEQRFRSMFERTHASMLLIDVVSGAIVDANAAASRFYGHPLETLRQMRIQEINQLPPELVAAERKAAAIEKRCSFVFPHRLANGEIRTVEVHSSPVAIRGKTLLFSIIHDITERKQAEEARRVSEENLRLIIDTSPIGICTVDSLGNFVMTNLAYEQILGYSKEELGNLSFFDVTHPEDRPKNKELFQSMFSLKSTGFSMEKRYVRKDGATINVAVNAAGVIDSTGHAVFGTAFIRDITEQKQAEEEILKLNTGLEQRVLDRTTELESVNKELEAFTYSVSHDLRAPLRAMDGFSKILIEDLANTLEDEQKKYLQHIRDGSQEMAQLIDDLLKLSRVTQREMTKDQVNLSEIVKELAEALTSADAERQVQFVIGDDIMAEGDPHLLRIALDNLIGNAWKFTGKTDKAVIQFGVEKKNGEDVFFVKDNGVGFDMTYVDKVFVAFQRLCSSEEFPGTGIGLATVQRVILRHGGRVWADAEKQKGATFRFVVQKNKDVKM